MVLFMVRTDQETTPESFYMKQSLYCLLSLPSHLKYFLSTHGNLTLLFLKVSTSKLNFQDYPNWFYWRLGMTVFFVRLCMHVPL